MPEADEFDALAQLVRVAARAKAMCDQEGKPYPPQLKALFSELRSLLEPHRKVMTAWLEAEERANCPLCREARRLAYSDATTPGFFFDTCERHRKKAANA